MPKPKVGMNDVNGPGKSLFDGVNLDSVWSGIKSKGKKANAKVQSYLDERKRQGQGPGA